MSDSEFVDVYSDENRVNIPVYPLDIFMPTDLGTAQTQGGTTRLPQDALAVLVLMDGEATVGDIEQKLPHLKSEAVRDLLRSLVAAGIVRPATIEETTGLDFSAFFKAGSGPEPSEGTKASADREAESGTPQLERTGYYVSIARKAVTARKPDGGARWSALLVEDDPDVSVLVARLLEAEGFEVTCAPSRDAVLARLNKAPKPDVAILDVTLPDINGFDLLQRLKAHPALKTIPVIMLTADAKRESVMRGLVTGADGYITKPFKREILLGGVKAVLGIDA